MSDSPEAVEVAGRAGGDDAAAVGPGARAEVDQPVGRADHRPRRARRPARCCPGPEARQAGEQPVGVAGMQPGGRLVEDVADADQPRADLGRQPDPLELAAGERVGPAAERQVAQADAVEERQPAGDLADQRRADPVERRLEPQAPRRTARASTIGRAETSWIDRPPTVTARASGRSREPSQAGQATGSRNDVERRAAALGLRRGLARRSSSAGRAPGTPVGLAVQERLRAPSPARRPGACRGVEAVPLQEVATPVPRARRRGRSARPRQGATAPCASDSERSGTTSSGSNAGTRAEAVAGRAGAVGAVEAEACAARAPRGPSRRPGRRSGRSGAGRPSPCRSATERRTEPSPSFRARSMLSASRGRIPSRTTSRSTRPRCRGPWSWRAWGARR